MKILSLSCQHCGAPLDVPESARYITCKFCDARLEVKHEGDVAFTEQLGEIERKTDQLIDEVSRLKLQNELARIDREWDQERESYMITKKDGRLSEPNQATAMLGMVVGVGFGIFWIAAVSATPAAPLFVPIGVVIIGVVLFTGIHGFQKADQYEAAKKRYDRSRSDVLDRLVDVE